MKILQVNHLRDLNQQNNTEYNCMYYKTKPLENDSVSFQAHRWKIPQKANTGLKKLLFGTGISAAAIWAEQNQFSFIPAMEDEIERVDLQSLNANLPIKAGFEVLPNNSGYRKGNLVVTAINPKNLKNKSASIDEKTLIDIDKAYTRSVNYAPLLENSAIVYVDLYDFKEGYKPIISIKDKASEEIVSVLEHQGANFDIYINPKIQEKYSMKIVKPKNKTEFGCLTVEKNSDYVINVQSLRLTEDVSIKYPDGTEKSLEDLYNTGEKAINGGNFTVNIQDNIYKDKKGILYKNGGFGRYCKIDDVNTKKEYYALSSDLALCSIDITKLPTEQAFQFYQHKPIIQKVFEVPFGTVITCGDTTLQATNEKRNFLYVNSRGNYRLSDKIDRSFKPIDNESKENGEAIIESALNDVEEKKFNEEYKARELKYSADNTPRNLSTLKETNRIPYVSMRETEFDETTKNYCKRVYDYYVNKYPEYKNYKFEFIDGIFAFWLGIKNGDEVIGTIVQDTEIIDGPVFEKSRQIKKLGEYTEVVPV